MYVDSGICWLRDDDTIVKIVMVFHVDGIVLAGKKANVTVS